MSGDTKQIVERAWSFAHVLRDEGLSYLSYIEQITFLLFLKMVDEIAFRNKKEPPLIPHEWGWASLIERSGPELISHYNAVLERLSHQSGMLGAIFRKPRPEIENPRTLRRLIVDFIGGETWTALEADVKGDIYEGLLARTASESPRGAGQYFTPRGLIEAIVDCVQPTTEDTVCDPAAGTGGFLLAALSSAKRSCRRMSVDAARHIERDFVRGWELVPNTARLCIMNLYLHGVNSDPPPIQVGVDALAQKPEHQFSLVLTNPPFGNKGSAGNSRTHVNIDKTNSRRERSDFWIETSNKQLNFLQHAHCLLKDGGRCAIVVPDNVLFEAGAGEAIRRKLFEECNVHTLLRLPSGIFYAQGVKANVLFFDKVHPPRKALLWIYDLRTNKRFSLRQRQIQRSDFDEFVSFYAEGNQKKREKLLSVEHQSSRWRAFEHRDLLDRKKLNLDISWLKDEEANATAASLPDPIELAGKISEDLRMALRQFDAVIGRLKEGERE